ncbi:MAG: hypothetical protein ABIT23_07340 [Nitrosospira sp.]
MTGWRAESEDRDKDKDKNKGSPSVLSVSELDDDLESVGELGIAELDAAASAKQRSGKAISAAMNTEYPNLRARTIRPALIRTLDRGIIARKTALNHHSQFLDPITFDTHQPFRHRHNTPVIDGKNKDRLETAVNILYQLQNAFAGLMSKISSRFVRQNNFRLRR